VRSQHAGDSCHEGRRSRRSDGLWIAVEPTDEDRNGSERCQDHQNVPARMRPIPSCSLADTARGRSIFNHVLKDIRSSTHGCQHMVEPPFWTHYDVQMQPDSSDIADRVLENGRQQVLGAVTGEPAEALAVLQFADFLRRSAERLAQASAVAARDHGASWRQIGLAVGGITPQGAEHRFSPAAKERRSKASKVEWTGKERRVVAR
jgi:hypothetical protein